jgi:hypothetical protein
MKAEATFGLFVPEGVQTLRCRDVVPVLLFLHR